MFEKNRTVAWSHFSFLTFKTHIIPKCQGSVVTKAPSQKTLRGGPFRGKALWKVAIRGPAPLIDCSEGPAWPCLSVANLRIYDAVCFTFCFYKTNRKVT